MPITLRLWQCLRGAQVTREFRQLLRLDQKAKNTQFWNIIAAVAALMLGPLALLLALPLGINFLCLQNAVQIANTINNQYRYGRRDVLAVTPIGGIGLLINVTRFYCRSLTYSVDTLLKVWGIVAGGSMLFFLIYGATVTELVQGVVILSLLVVGLFIDFMQCVIWAMVVAIFAGINADGFKTNVYAFVGYFSVQLLFYAGFTASLLFVALANIPPIMGLLLFFVVFILFFTAREGIIYGIWRLIRERTNDDLPILKQV